MIPEITPEQSLEWKEREKKRLEDGTYTPLPLHWRDSTWFQDVHSKESIDEQSGRYLRCSKYPDHFAHISIDRVAMIAFTENEQKGVRDRQTRINPGKYLAKFFSDYLSKEDIQYLATQMGAEYNDDAELKFAVTADKFEEVYTSGPGSCMSHNEDHFESDTHPVRVYAGFDLQLAYLKREDRITARALCWPSRKIYGRVYGDETRLEHLLAKEGYEKGSLHGARITKLMQDGAYVIPFLDYLAGATDAGKHLVLCENTRLDGKRVKLCCDGGQQNGLSSDPSSEYACYSCDDEVDGDDVREFNGRNYCESCFYDRFSYCDRSADYVRNEEIEEVRVRPISGGGWEVHNWGESARTRYAFWCYRDEVWYSNAGNLMYRMHHGAVWGPEAFERDGITIDGVNYDKADLPEGVTLPEHVHDEVKVNQAALPLEPAGEITVDCWVVALDSIEGEFTAGRMYNVSRVYNGGANLSFYADDSGDTNGWTRDKFRPHTPAPQQAGLHIRHTPDQMWLYKLFHHDLYLDGFNDKNSAECFQVELNNNPSRLCDLIARRQRSPLNPVARQPEEVA